MKQFITIDQLNELTENQKNKLCQWSWIPEVGDKIAGYWLDENDNMTLQDFGFIKRITDNGLIDNGWSIYWLTNNILPLLSIGQCISVLTIWCMYRSWRFLGIDLSNIFIIKLQKTNGEIVDIIGHTEIIDTLWEAIKIALI